MKARTILVQAVFYSALALLWQGLAALRLWPDYVLPGPLQVLETLVSGCRDLSLPWAVAMSLRRLLAGYSISIALGVSLGLCLGRFALASRTLGSLALGLQTLPSICWLPLALLWFGLNERAIVFVVVMGALLSIAIATEAGVRSVSPSIIKAGRNMGARRLALYWEVILPAALPHIVSGLKQGWSFAWRSLMAGELLFGNRGLGYQLLMGRELNDMSRVIAVMLVIAAISILIDKLVFGRAERGIRRRWGLAAEPEP